jgi:hypothetical protein
MAQILQIASNIGTPLALLSFIAVLGFYAYSRYLKHQERKLEALPSGERASAVDKYLTRYKVQAGDLSKEAREGLIKDEMEKHYRLARLYTLVSAGVFVICFLAAVAAYNTREPKKIGYLSLSVQDMRLTEPSGINLDSNEFKAGGSNDLIDQAAKWVKSTLDRRFPRNDEEIQVTAGVKLDRTGGNHEVHLEPRDKLRIDRFWVFTTDLKEGHPNLLAAGEATKDVINHALAGGSGNLSKLVLHMDRPGYDLGLIEVPIGQAPKTVTLRRLPEPALTVIVDSISSNEPLAERLRAKLRDLGVVVGTPDFYNAKRKAYERSLGKNLTDSQRLIHLREARIDAFVRGTYEERPE